MVFSDIYLTGFASCSGVIYFALSLFMLSLFVFHMGCGLLIPYYFNEKNNLLDLHFGMVNYTDPNRPGMHMKLINFLLKLKASRIVYVSCNPATCARDLDYLCNGVVRICFLP